MVADELVYLVGFFKITEMPGAGYLGVVGLGNELS
jgi:hypothetical protein